MRPCERLITPKWGTLETILVVLVLCVVVPDRAVGQGIDATMRAQAVSLGDAMNSAGKKAVAVVDFTDLQSNVTELGRFLAEELSVALASQRHGFATIDRTHLKTILAEHKLSSTGVIDQQTAQKLGQIAGVDSLVTGTITPLGETIRLSIKLLDVATARVLHGAAADITKTRVIEDLLGRGISASSTVATTGSAAEERSPAESQSVAEVSVGAPLCRRTGAAVRCSMTFLNEGGEGRASIVQYEAKIGGRTYPRAFDERGQEYRAETSQLGSERTHTWRVYAYLVSRVPTQGSVTFTGISSSVASFALLEVPFCAPSGSCGRLQFRGVPITR